MIESDPQHMPRTWGVGRPMLQFAMLSLVLLIVVGVIADAVFGVFLAPIVMFSVIAVLSLRGLAKTYPHPGLGACNCVTLGRAALVAVLLGAVFETGFPWVVFGLATIAFALDGVDGWLARRSGRSSDFGANFDMEIDALLGAVLALVLLASGTVGPAILILGFSRYVFVLDGLVWPALRGTLPESFRRKAICVVQIAALILLVFPLTPSALLMPIALIAATALLYSFATDAVALLRHGQ